MGRSATVLVDQPAELAGLDQAAADVVVPDVLPVTLHLEERVRHTHSRRGVT